MAMEGQRADSPAAARGELRAGGCPKEGCDPVGSPHWNRLPAEPMDMWREVSTLQSRLSGRTCDHTGTDTGAVSEELQPVGRTHIEAVCELSLVGGTCAGAGEELEESSP